MVTNDEERISDADAPEGPGPADKAADKTVAAEQHAPGSGTPVAEASAGSEQQAHAATADTEGKPSVKDRFVAWAHDAQGRLRKGVIVAGVIVAVVIVGGAGLWIWHGQPSFCNAFCHSPMDHYVETYYEGDPGMLVTAHAQAGDSCLDCHEAEPTTQISEVMAWVSDTYPMTEDGTMLATGKEFADEEFCLRSGCHEYSDVVANTWGFEGNEEKFNPHSSHQDLAFDCGDCHKVHEKSVLMCAECHNLNVPEGWEVPGE